MFGRRPRARRANAARLVHRRHMGRPGESRDLDGRRAGAAGSARRPSGRGALRASEVLDRRCAPSRMTGAKGH